MRILFFADIHGNGPAFESFLKHLEREKYDRIIFVGDFMGYYYNAVSILRYCRDNKIECLLGNHDSYFLRMLDGQIDEATLVKKYGNSYSIAKNEITPTDLQFLRSLPTHLSFESHKQNIFACHGSPNDYLEGRIYPDTDLSLFAEAANKFEYIVCANTHHKIVRKFGSSTFFNPGSLGQQRDGKGCSYLLLDTASGDYEFKIVTYQIEKLEEKIDLIDNGRLGLKSVLRRTT